MRATQDSQALAETLGRPGVRVRTLVRLRWSAIAGQLATLLTVALVFAYPVPWPSVLAAIAASVLLNLGLTSLYQRNAQLVGGEALLHLAFDLVQLGVLLFLTGGLANPFCVLLLVPVTISATLLSAPATAMLAGLAILILFGLWFWALPLPWSGGTLVLPDVYRMGVFAAVALGMFFLGIYAWQVSAEARRWQQALIATEAALERESKMSALGALAAVSAHELGGPLGTITLVARELVERLGNDPEFGEDVRLLEAEAKRSREILVGIAQRAEAEDPFPALSLEAVLHEVAAPYARPEVDLLVELGPKLEEEPPVVARTPELLHGLANIVANAVRHASSWVRIAADRSGSELTISISDDGPGFDPTLLPRLGEPYLGPSRSKSGGTGLGIFIATTLIERTGGRLSFANAAGGGAQVDIRWRREHIEVTKGA